MLRILKFPVYLQNVCGLQVSPSTSAVGETAHRG